MTSLKSAAVVGLLEPASFSLQNSIAWALVSRLKARQKIAFADEAVVSGGLIGAIPILQPIRVYVNGQSAFLVMLKAVFDIPAEFKPTVGNEYTLRADGETIARLSTYNTGRHKTQHRRPARLDARPRLESDRPYILRFLSVSTKLAQFTDENLVALRRYTSFLTDALWPVEPISNTTAKLHITSEGRFALAEEFYDSGHKGGELVIAQNTAFIRQAPRPMLLPFRNWQGGGKAGAIIQAAASGTACGVATSFNSDSSSYSSGGNTSDSSWGGGSSGGGGGGGGSSGGGWGGSSW